MVRTYILNDNWKEEIENIMRRYLTVNYYTKYTVNYTSQGHYYLPKHNIEPFTVVIGIDIDSEHEEKYLGKFLIVIKEILRKSPVISLMRGKVMINGEEGIEFMDVFNSSIWQFETLKLGNQDIDGFKEILNKIRSLYGGINLLIYYTGKEIKNIYNPGFPTIWALTKGDEELVFGDKVVVFNRS